MIAPCDCLLIASILNIKPKVSFIVKTSSSLQTFQAIYIQYITNNLCDSVENWSRGIIKDIVVYEKAGVKAPELPAIFWTEIDTYNGPSFIPNNAHRKIRPISHKWWAENRNKKRGQVGSRMDKTNWIENSSRTMVPIWYGMYGGYVMMSLKVTVDPA